VVLQEAKLRYAVVAILIASVPVALTLLSALGSAEGSPQEPIWPRFVTSAVVWYPFAILAPLIDRRVRRFTARSSRDYARTLGGHLAIVTVFVLAHGALVHAAVGAVGTRGVGSVWYMIRGRIIPDVIIYAAMAAAFAVTEARRRQTEMAERLRAEVAEARLEALRQQLNPHFLFNTLNHIVSELRSLRTAGVEPALKMLLALSELLRDVLRERAQRIPLRDELRMVERYLEIERARFGDRLQAEVTYEPRALDALVPSLFLQPLVENSLRHGVSAATGRCEVLVTVRVRETRLLIEIRDAGPGLDSARAGAAAGVGLTNTSERLRYLYGSDHTFTLESHAEGGLRVAIDLPLERS
jgi:two-component sensor histidine kinase